MNDGSTERIDRSRLEEIGMGDTTFTLEIIQMMIQDGEARVKAIREACDHQTWDAAGKEAHSLKGSALNVGAFELAKLCAQIDDAARTLKSTVETAMVETVEQEFESVRQQLLQIRSELEA
jgi:HPt (histidine-containing phosphotransfer) domain-containing protein